MPTRSGPNRFVVPALKRGFTVNTLRGKLVVKKWPRRRGKPKHPHTIWMNHWLREQARMMKYVNSHAMDFAIKAAKGTGLYPRDILLKLATNGLIDIVIDGQGTVVQRQQGITEVAFQGIQTQLEAAWNFPQFVNIPIPWPVPTIDTAGMWSIVNPTRITIPNGVNVVRLNASSRGSDNRTARVALNIIKNGVDLVASADDDVVNWHARNPVTTPLEVATGDYFEAIIFSSNVSPLAPGPASSFACEILDANIPTPP